MDVGRCAARLTEFASVLEVPLISWPMSRLHARNPRSPPTTYDDPLRPPATIPPFLASRLIVFARLRFRVRHACGALRREYSSCLRFSIRVIRSGFCIVHHFAVYLMRKKAFKALIPLCITLRCVRVMIITDDRQYDGRGDDRLQKFLHLYAAYALLERGINISILFFVAMRVHC